MAIQTHFNNFDKKIYITTHSDEYKDAKNKDDSILKDIKTKFKEQGYIIIEPAAFLRPIPWTMSKESRRSIS